MTSAYELRPRRSSSRLILNLTGATAGLSSSVIRGWHVALLDKPAVAPKYFNGRQDVRCLATHSASGELPISADTTGGPTLEQGQFASGKSGRFFERPADEKGDGGIQAGDRGMKAAAGYLLCSWFGNAEPRISVLGSTSFSAANCAVLTSGFFLGGAALQDQPFQAFHPRDKRQLIVIDRSKLNKEVAKVALTPQAV